MGQTIKTKRKSTSKQSANTQLIVGILIIIGLFLVVVGVAALLRHGSGSGNEATAPIIGAHAPDFTTETLDGKTVNLKSLRGKPVVLNFWATWCPPCRAEMPMLQQAYDSHKGQYTMLAVNDGEPTNQVQAFIQEKGFTFTVLLDPGQRIVRKYQIQGFPTTFFIDSQGVIRYMHVGMLTPSTLASGLKSIGIQP